MKEKNFPYKIIDLTHDLSPEVPSWEGNCGFVHEIEQDYDHSALNTTFRVQSIQMYAGIGTHIDAPSHCIPGGKSINELKLQDLITSCIVIDVSAQAGESYRLSPDDLSTFEKSKGVIPPNSFVIIRTGWERFWLQEKYRNNLVFPSISEKAARMLLERNIAGLGIDTLSPDRPEDGYPVHRAVLGAGKYIVENIANSALLPSTGSYSLALPIKAAGGTEAPIRLIALIPN